ncbi:MAG: hypothetical protein KDC26_07660 [Armatimonadetes bacterium]|nr:hypothetical protein [Armatimonadota bacterium]
MISFLPFYVSYQQVNSVEVVVESEDHYYVNSLASSSESKQTELARHCESDQLFGAHKILSNGDYVGVYYCYNTKKIELIVSRKGKQVYSKSMSSKGYNRFLRSSKSNLVIIDPSKSFTLNVDVKNRYSLSSADVYGDTWADWRFVLAREGEDGWERIMYPHTWLLFPPFDMFCGFDAYSRWCTNSPNLIDYWLVDQIEENSLKIRKFSMSKDPDYPPKYSRKMVSLPIASMQDYDFIFATNELLYVVETDTISGYSGEERVFRKHMTGIVGVVR